jgi:ABC-type sulfate/molybdate transport systems ATPase subunit
MLTVRQLRVQNGATTIVDDVSFDVPNGFVLGLYGPSGAGKSTTIHALFGLLDSTFKVAGNVQLDSCDISNRSPEERSEKGMAIVLQGLALFPHLSAIENVAYPLRRRGLRGEAALARAAKKLAEFRMEQFAYRRPKQLSGGQQQRVALARATAYAPSLLLLDEPFKGLEQEFRDDLLASVRQMAREGTSIVLVTHEKRDLQLAADGVIAFRDGRIVATEHHDSAHARQLFALSANGVLIPNGNGSNVRAHKVRLLCPGEAPNLGEHQTQATILEVRRVPNGSAVLLRFESDDVRWIETHELDASMTAPEGSLVHLAYAEFN